MPQLFLSILFSLSALLSAYLAAWSRLHKKVNAAGEIFWLVLCIAIYSLGYAIEILQTNLKGILIAIRLEYLGISFIPAFLLMFALKYVREKELSKPLFGLLLIIPFITLFLVWTQQYHNLYYISPRVIEGEFFPVLDFERGFWYYVQGGYNLLAIFINMSLLTFQSLRSKRHRKAQSITLAVGTAVPFLGTSLYYLGFIPGNIDPIPLTLTISISLYWFALFKLGLIRLVPAARELAIDSIKEAFLVIDQHQVLQDMNRAAKQLPGSQELIIQDIVPQDNELIKNLQPLLRNEKENLEFFSKGRCYSAHGYPIIFDLDKAEGESDLDQ